MTSTIHITVPPELAALKQWVLWRNIPRVGSTKATKIPYTTTGHLASTSDPSSWSSFTDACAGFEQGGYTGIGFVFTASDPFCGIDLDDCIDDTGKLKPWAEEIIGHIPSYREISPSGKGVKIWIAASLPEGKGLKAFVNREGVFVAPTDKLNYDGAIEIYDRGRYFTVTGQVLANSSPAINDYSQLIGEVVKSVRSAQTEHACGDAPSAGFDKFELPKETNSGERHNTLNRYAASLRAQNKDWQDIFDALKLLNSSFAEPKAEQELSRLADYWIKKAPGHSKEWQAAHPQEVAGGATGRLTTETPADSDKEFLKDFRPIEGEPGQPAPKPNDIAGLVLRDHTLLVDQTGSLFEYTGKCWKQQDKHILRSYALSYDTRQHTNTKRRAQVMDLVMDQKRKDEIPWRRLEPSEVPCSNCVVDVNTLETREHRPEDYLETVMPIDYVEGQECQAWENALTRWFLDDPDQNAKISAIQEFFGYTLLPHARYKKALFLLGEGDTGKSQVALVLGELVGTNNKCTISTKDMDDPMKRAPIVGKMLNILTELPSTAMISDGGFKQLVSTGDPIQIDPKYRAGFSYTPFCKHVICTNRLPSVNDLSSATFNRILLVEFNNVIPKSEQDPGLLDKLRQELPGILLWSLKGASRLVRSEGEFTPVSSARRTIREYREEQNPINTFLAEMCVIKEYNDFGAPNRIAMQEFRQAYAKWNNGKGIEPCTMTRMLKSAGYRAGLPRKDSTGRCGRYLMGVRWKNEDDRQAEVAGEMSGVGRGNLPLA